MKPLNSQKDGGIMSTMDLFDNRPYMLAELRLEFAKLDAELVLEEERKANAAIALAQELEADGCV